VQLHIAVKTVVDYEFIFQFDSPVRTVTDFVFHRKRLERKWKIENVTLITMFGDNRPTVQNDCRCNTSNQIDKVVIILILMVAMAMRVSLANLICFK
jgi:hypothetical protein